MCRLQSVIKAAVKIWQP